MEFKISEFEVYLIVGGYIVLNISLVLMCIKLHLDYKKTEKKSKERDKKFKEGEK